MKKYYYLIIFFGFSIILRATCYGQICMSGWQYYTPITVTNNVSSILTNYDVKITVNTKALFSSAHMLSSAGNDIRFVDPATCSNLSYWIESGINSGATVIWVKIPSLNGSTSKTINMYYGNSSAPAASNGDSTFLVFDDFNDSSLNTSKWSTYTGGGSITQTGGQIHFSATSGIHNFATIRSKSAFSVPLFVESLNTSVSGYYPSIAILNSNTFSGYALTYGDSNNNNEMILFKATTKGGTFGGGQSITQTNPGTLTGLWQLSWPSANVQTGKWPGGTLNGTMSYYTPSNTANIGAGMLYSGNGSMSMDWIRARPYASAEPSSSIGTEVNNYYLLVSPINGSPFCTSSADSFYISFTEEVSITFNSNNVFTAQLSDSSGSFANPTDIGSLASTNVGNILVKIPTGTYGRHFRIRIVNTTDTTYNSVPSSSVLAFFPLAKPAFSINSITQCLKGNNFVFNNNTSGTGTISYRWSFGDGVSSTATSPLHTYAGPGKYNVTLTAINIAGCPDSISKSINVYGAVSSFSVNNSTQCFNGNSFIFSNKSSGYNNLSYLWDFGDGNTSNAYSPTYNYTAAGVYSVKLYATADSLCIDTSVATITVNPKVFAGFNISNTSTCLNQQNIQFTNSSTISPGSLSYKWSFGDGNASTSTSPIYSYNAAGAYRVKLTATSNAGCSDTISKSVTVYPLPTATAKAAGATIICDGGRVTISANVAAGYQYQWLDNGGKIISSGTGSAYDATKSGSYRVVITNSDGCSDTSSATVITVNPLPPAPVISQVNRLLKSNSNEAAYQWYLDGVLINGADSMNYSPIAQKGSFTVTVTDSNGCSNSSAVYQYDVSAINIHLSGNYLHIYPNPAHDYLNIDLGSGTTDIQSLQMIDMNGRCVKLMEHFGDKGPIKVSTGDIAKGMYFIKFTSKENTFIQKVVVE